MERIAMPFTDDDLKRTKEQADYGEKLNFPCGLEASELKALLARLEKSESLLQEGLERMKLINGPDENCIIGGPDSTCKNHAWIHEVEAQFKEFAT